MTMIDETTTFFQTGAVAFVDVMGFKGISEHYTPPQVLAKLREMKETFEKFHGPLVYGGGASREFLALSDSMIFSSSVSEDAVANEGGVESWLVLGDLCAALEAVWWAALQSGDVTPPFALRGAVAWGEHLTFVHPYVIGPAVDEAARGEGQPEGAFIWFTDSTEKVLDRVFETEAYRESGIPVVRYEIAMKQVKDRKIEIVERECWVLRPRVAAAEVRDLLWRAFRLDKEDDPKIRAKFDETIRFFKATEGEQSGNGS